MNRQAISKKSRDELNRSLLTLYKKLTFNLDALPEKEEEKPNNPVYTDTEPDHPDKFEK